MKIEPRTLTQIIDTEFREFSMYTIENRAIPSVIDGLKPTQRKLLYAMITEYKGHKTKVAELGGGLAKMNYHHGEGSAQGAAIGLGSDWNNNAPVFTGHGNFGSRLVPEAAAPSLSWLVTHHRTASATCLHAKTERHVPPLVLSSIAQP